MKIIIGGAGEVGLHLAKLLAAEDQDMILMDPDEEKLNFPSNTEIMTIVGNPTSIRDLKLAGINGADMFIGVTPEESTNMTACMLAHNLGAKKTIARISNEEYLLLKNTEFFTHLGVDSLICPEILAANEIVSALKTPWTRQWWEIAGGLILLGIKIREKAPLVNKYLYDIGREHRIYHIVAIKRGNETIIPRGNDQILAEDILYITTTQEYINEVKKDTGKENIDINKITIMGAGRIALKVCEQLPHNIQIKLLEINKERSYRVAEKVDSNVLVINGDGRNTDVLIQENVKNSSAFIALTGNSEANILACVAAKSLGVPKTIAEVENIDYIQLAEKLNIGNVINKKLIASSHIYQFLLDADVSSIKCLAVANADAAELVARAGSKITKKQVKDLRLPHDFTLGGRIHSGKAEIVHGDTLIEPGDHVVVFCLNTAMRKIEDYFN
ncbi:MAG: Trk system potassium transporter TrkA [Dysgonamonadaceae bacterium]|jgi:trk system potassium uptake protein TrkA|nr:Trk system potassium transporter TrkA [Dysgonamonadaceae bacterium]